MDDRRIASPFVIDNLSAASDGHLLPPLCGLRRIGDAQFCRLSVGSKQSDKTALPFAVDQLERVAQRITDVTVQLRRAQLLIRPGFDVEVVDFEIDEAPSSHANVAMHKPLWDILSDPGFIPICCDCNQHGCLAIVSRNDGHRDLHLIPRLQIQACVDLGRNVSAGTLLIPSTSAGWNNLQCVVVAPDDADGVVDFAIAFQQALCTKSNAHTAIAVLVHLPVRVVALGFRSSRRTICEHGFNAVFTHQLPVPAIDDAVRQRRIVLRLHHFTFCGRMKRESRAASSVTDIGQPSAQSTVFNLPVTGVQ